MLLLNKKNIFMFYLLYNWALDIFPKFFRTQSRVQLFDNRGCNSSTTTWETPSATPSSSSCCRSSWRGGILRKLSLLRFVERQPIFSTSWTALS